jgi:hypothetical protein
MGIASVELGGVAFADRNSSSINGRCIRQESLTISGSTATLASAVSVAEVKAGVSVARVSANDVACMVATGTTPNPVATSATAATTAGRLLAIGASIELPIAVDEFVAVKAVP